MSPPRFQTQKEGFSTDKLSYVGQLPPGEKALLNSVTPMIKSLQSRIPTQLSRTSHHAPFNGHCTYSVDYCSFVGFERYELNNYEV